MLLEDRHGDWEVLVDDPLDECLVGVLLLAIVGECIFHPWACVLHRGFGHLDDLVVDTVNFVREEFCSLMKRGEIPFLFKQGTDIMAAWTLGQRQHSLTGNTS